MMKTMLSFAFWVTFVTFIPRLIIDTQAFDLELSDLVTRIQMGLDDALNVYQQRSTGIKPPGVWIYINYLCVASGFISWLYTPLAILLWHRLSISRRLITVTFWASAVVSSVARGQNFGVFDLGIRIVIFVLIRKYFLGQDVTELTPKATRAPRMGRRRWGAGYVLAAVALLTFMIGFFANTMRSRVGDRFDHLLAFGGHYVAIDRHSLIWILCPDFLKPICATFVGYVSHGYMGLELSLQRPFESTLGLGSSFFLIDNAAEMFGVDVLPLTYQDKAFAAYGYHYSALWHTAYTWIANDVSFWGVPIVLFFIMFVFGSAWYDFVVSRNIFGALLMAPMAIMFAFISANNQLTGNPNALAAVIILTAAWSATRYTYDWAGALRLLSGPQNSPK